MTGRDVRDAGYLLLGPVFGGLWVALVGAIQVSGVASRFAPLGIAFFLAAHLLLRPIGRFERLLVRALLAHDVPAPTPVGYRRATAPRWRWPVDRWRWTLAVVRDAHSWRVLAWLLIRLVVGPVGAAIVLLYAASPLLLAAPLVPLADLLSDRFTLDAAWTGWLLLGPVGFAPAAPLLREAVRGLARWHRRLADWALGPGRREVEAAVLARAVRAEEQVRIDQELHDSIGHLLSMIVVQAGAGAHVFDRDPAFARHALETIGERGRAALGELDRIIAGIRDDGSDHLRPLPGVGDLAALLDGAADAGMRVRSRIRLRPVPLAVGRGVYRVVQESLTNAAKHARGCDVDVEVVADERVVAVAVDNPLPRPRPGGGGGGGTGLASIRDRVALLGGRATAGPTGDGGFAVRAVVPLGAALPDGAAACRLDAGCDCLGCSVRRTVPG
ncbi:sensor domain-containing protein [Catellatospora sp. KI3]|uniref:sensor histidine kinase n=1 Tax=Catellatospora sp. KI3 TaxID=3041620 RepID=UPI002482FA8B|nr:sensor domain-containing protein [Catellatospora sp. KI3]MDI1463758.1 sensor domain-containing protein [Catellatospora sp. KI3]